jgi:RNA polymerase sigma factor (sigma-70 family)
MASIDAEDERHDPTEDLLRAWSTGDADALGRLLREHQGWLLVRARRELSRGDRVSLESVDLVQEAFARLLRRGPRYTPRSRAEFRALMAKVLRGALADDRAKRMAIKRDAHKVERLPDEGISRIVAAGSGVATPSGVYADRERIEALEEAIESLPEEPRDICRRKYFEGQTFEQIAAALGLPGGDAARMRFNRALPKLARALEKRGQTE